MNTIEPGRFTCRLLQTRTRRAQILALIGAIALASVIVHRTQQKAVAESGAAVSKQSHIQLARVSGEVTVHAAGRGNPWINLSDGHELLTPYRGPAELTTLLERNEARPLSLCSADFDEDGVPDLISGYAGPNGGIVTLLRGNVDSIYPNAPEAQQRRAEGTFTDAPFLSPAFAFGLSEAADFIGAGDFDGDGHWDVVTAARGSDRLCLMSADGIGGLREKKRIDLPGGVTAMVVGEINRRDGLDDVVVGVSGKQGSKVLVFEGPEGALRASPEVLDLPAEAASLALGQLDDSYEMDLAIAAGRELMIVHGRDRKLSLDEESRSSVREAGISRRSFPSAIRSIALGDFAGNLAADVGLLFYEGTVSLLSVREAKSQAQTPGGRATEWTCNEIAHQALSNATQLVCARTSSVPQDNLLVVASKSHRLQILADDNRTRDEGAPATVSASIDVDGEPVAVLPVRANEDALSDMVVLRSGRTAPTILETTASMIFTVLNTNDRGPGSLRQAILDANASPGFDFIDFRIPGDGVPIIKLTSSETPFDALPVVTEAVSIDGTTQSAGRVELDGTNAGFNAAGPTISGGNSVARGLVVTNFGGNGLTLQSKSGNLIEGNTISGNLRNGVEILFVPNNKIGGTVAAARNIISDNPILEGLFINGSSASNNIVQGNYIGTDKKGKAIDGNNTGITISDGMNNMVGGTTAGGRNVISGNVREGIATFRGSGNLVQGNFIGTNASGDAAVRNLVDGIFLGFGERGTTIGGTATAARNIISGNLGDGVEINGSLLNNQVQGNFIGTDKDGIRAIPNSGSGVAVIASNDTIVGGGVAGARNLISANGKYGIGIGEEDLISPFPEPTGGSPGTLVMGNSIGTDVAGSIPMGNGLDGIFVDATGSVDSKLGGAAPGEANIIAFNGRSGISLPNTTFRGQNNPSKRIRIVSNLVFSNAMFGIDLGPAGITQNDDMDVDDGANELQNFPIPSTIAFPTRRNASGAIIAAAVTTTITGTFNSTPQSVFTLQFFFGTNCSGSGHQFTGFIPIALQPTIQVTTDSNGNAAFSFTFDLPANSSSGFVNATATNATGNTSEFSDCIGVTNPNAPAINGACRGEAKQLIINGSGFVEGAKVFLNGEPEKTSFVSSTQVIAKKAGKRAQTGDTLKVRNPDGSETAVLVYTRNNCSP
ncbi:MAG TPA: hypothetical protein VN687_19420 [Blastocatellia bacterium]|nr:hypothetical protein [Blastocatellia bacterium]